MGNIVRGDRVKIKNEVFQQRHFIQESQLRNNVGIVERIVEKHPDFNFPGNYIMDMVVRFTFASGRSTTLGFYFGDVVKVNEPLNKGEKDGKRHVG